MRPNVVVLGDSNTLSFGPAWVTALVRQGWPTDQVVLHHRSGTTPRHWLPKAHALYQSRFGTLWARTGRRHPSVRNALSPATRLVIIGLGGNMVPGSRDEDSVEALLDEVVKLAPWARILWRGPPPSTCSSDGTIATRATRASRYRRNGMLKALLGPLHFEIDDRPDPSASRVYLDVIALHACGPARGLRLGVGRDEDFRAERELVASLSRDRYARNETAIRGPWDTFIKARDSLPSHVPKRTAADMVQIVADQGFLKASRKALSLPLAATVINDGARLRARPPGFKWLRGKTVSRGTKVLLQTWRGRYAKVLDARTREPLGWMHRANVVATSRR